jgi:hypothetical protein
MEFLMMLAGIVTGGAAASLVVFAWAASQLRWLAAHCHQHVTYWRQEAERAKATAARLREQHVADRHIYIWAGQRAGSTDE